MKKVERKKRVVPVLLSILLVLSVGAIFTWNHYINKSSLVGKFNTPQGQEVYMLGTFHKMHFDKWLNYSMEDILNAVKNIKPDILFIEAREEYFAEYGVMDGPVDMALVYSYALANNIPVEMIDWWIVENDSKMNTTNKKRDDMIFSNIENKLAKYDQTQKILVVCGAAHFHAQKKRFIKNDFRQEKLKSRKPYFAGDGSAFSYPSGIDDVWENRSYFYAYIFPKIIEQDPNLNDKAKSQFVGGNKDEFYARQLEYNRLFAENELYQK